MLALRTHSSGLNTAAAPQGWGWGARERGWERGGCAGPRIRIFSRGLPPFGRPPTAPRARGGSRAPGLGVSEVGGRIRWHGVSWTRGMGPGARKRPLARKAIHSSPAPEE